MSPVVRIASLTGCAELTAIGFPGQHSPGTVQLVQANNLVELRGGWRRIIEGRERIRSRWQIHAGVRSSPVPRSR